MSEFMDLAREYKTATDKLDEASVEVDRTLAKREEFRFAVEEAQRRLRDAEHQQRRAERWVSASTKRLSDAQATFDAVDFRMREMLA